MKKYNIANIVLYLILSLCFLFVGCKDNKQNDTLKIKHINVAENYHLSQNAQSPSCDLSIDFDYLDSYKDSIASVINKTIFVALLGKQYESLSAKEAVDSFKNVYITSYKNEIGKLYAEDQKNNPDEKDVLPWYNFKYNLVNKISEGKQGIINVIGTTYEYTGGAHPNEWGKWMNFFQNTGAIITYNDVFMKGSELIVTKLLTDKLIEFISDKYKDKKIDSIDALHNIGILTGTDMYISDNFLIGKDEISFLYNSYDIAPYSVGQIILSLSYSEIEKVMLLQ